MEIEARREAGLPVGSTAGALIEERRDALEAIDPSWCPAWPVAWQRCYKLCRNLIEAGAPLPAPGEATVQGEDLGAWVMAQRLNWEQLLPAQQWMLQNMLHIGPGEASEWPPAPRTQADKWAANMAAARQFHAREGSLQTVPRKAVVHLTEPDGTVTDMKLGLFIDNCRRRADKLSAERRAELDALGMRW
jgi:hypothetical protein